MLAIIKIWNSFWVLLLRFLFDFLEHNSTKTVIFTGSSSSRNRLYRIIFSKFYPQLKHQFQIQGFINDQIEAFEPNKNFTGFYNFKNTKEMTSIKSENKNYIKNIIFDEKKNNAIYEAKKTKALHIAKITLKQKTELV